MGSAGWGGNRSDASIDELKDLTKTDEQTVYRPPL